MSGDSIKRFYKESSVVEGGAGFGVALDGRLVKTPGGVSFRAPTRALAEAIAEEWAAQGERIFPARMPLTQFAFASVDHTPLRRAALSPELARYMGTDLVAHRAASPAELVARQSAAWDPLVDWGQGRFQFRVPVVIGVLPAEISAQSLASVQAAIAALDDFRCTALAQAIILAGSALIGFALIEGWLSAADAFAAAMLDELWSLERWGEDGEARARLDRQRAEFEALARFVAALSG